MSWAKAVEGEGLQRVGYADGMAHFTLGDEVRRVESAGVLVGYNGDVRQQGEPVTKCIHAGKLLI